MTRDAWVYRFLQLVGNAIGSTSVQFLADSVCCGTTWIRFFYFSEQRSPGNAHGAYAGDNHRVEVGGLCSTYLTCCVQARGTRRTVFLVVSNIFALFRFFFFSLRSVVFQHRCPAHGAAELAACVVGVCVSVRGDCACCFAVALGTQLTCLALVLAACSAEDIWRCSMCSRSQHHNGEKSQHARKLRTTRPTRKFRNQRFGTITDGTPPHGWSSLQKYGGVNRQLRHIFSFPTPAGHGVMVCPDRYFVKC